VLLFATPPGSCRSHSITAQQRTDPNRCEQARKRGQNRGQLSHKLSHGPNLQEPPEVTDTAPRPVTGAGGAVVFLQIPLPELDGFHGADVLLEFIEAWEP
jgi:hypothetical protein